MKPRLFIGASLICTVFSLPALAQENPEIQQRQGQFNLFVHNFALLGGMAQGRVDYDAELAQTAADNLFHVTRHNQSRLWPEGTDAESVEGTRALPAIWENLDDFMVKFAGLQDAAEGAQAVAGDGLDALRPAVGALGAACQACHQTYRAEAG
ncbi:c-type cytochrome [Roseinatronobacter alkalisoli]|uniref:Cytochrome c n=1 Tax=Roseinatronobacter alkalisoli TaxID=3028235 RepID=A0ABT5T8G8_9RHOB|nr:cytochrome c [Roseinatronobacter sp. HJB301]MDD7971254.1 cytochrome c [Roseinatronobacter sp. HJB301]